MPRRTAVRGGGRRPARPALPPPPAVRHPDLAHRWRPSRPTRPGRPAGCSSWTATRARTSTWPTPPTSSSPTSGGSGTCSTSSGRRGSRSRCCTSAAAASRCRATSRPPGRGPGRWSTSTTAGWCGWPASTSGLRPLPGLRVRVGDARQRLAERPAGSADVVVGDAFSGVLVPPHLATLEFAAEVRRVLRPDGVYVLNVIDCPPLRVSRAEAATLLAAFRARRAHRRPGPAARAGRRQRRLRRRPRCRCRWPSWPGAAARGQFPDDLLDRAAVARFAGAVPGRHATPDADRWRRLAPPPDLPVPLTPA